MIEYILAFVLITDFFFQQQRKEAKTRIKFIGGIFNKCKKEKRQKETQTLILNRYL